MTTDVVIAGAGPTGLTLACELARYGVSATVLDAADGPRPGSRGKGLQPRSLELLDRLDVAGRLVSLGRFDLPVRRWTDGPDGEPVGIDGRAQDGRVPGPDAPYHRGLLLPQWRTEQVLRERLAELGGTVRWGTRVTGVTERADGVDVHTTAGDLGARWVVGCDGGSSVVRRAAGVAFVGETREDVRMMLGDLVVEGADRDCWHLWDGVALCPLAGTEEFQFQAVDPLPPGDDRLPGLADFAAVLDRATAGRIRVREVRWASRWRLNERLVERYRQGRLLLAGDAAHVHSPAGGQGMNTGIGDAVNLGWKLAAVLDGADVALLDTYEAERQPVAAHVLGLSGRLLHRPLDDRGSDGLESLQLALSYRNGPLAAGPDGRCAPVPAGPGPVSGDRAPDAPLRDGHGRRVRLSELLRGPGWTVLGFGTSPPELPGVRAVRVQPDASGDGLHDTYGHAATAYRPEPGELVLVRPDGHLGLRTTDPDAPARYLAGVRSGAPASCSERSVCA